MSMIFTQILNMSLTASWLILAVILLRVILKKAPKSFRMILWAFVGIRLICPFSFESVFSLIPNSEPITYETVQSYVPTQKPEQQSTPVNAEPIADKAVSQPENTSPLPESAGAVPSVMVSDANSDEANEPAIADSLDPVQLFFTYGYILWLIGITGMLLYTFISYFRTYRKVQESIPLSESIRLCDHISTPFILGILRPRIYLPSNMDTKDMEYVIAHETAHLKRGDHLWKPLGFFLLTVYWFQPLVWVAYILFCRDVEFACDEIVIRNMGTEQKQPYSNALLNCSIPKRTLAACPLAFGEGSVKERIKAVLSYRKPSKTIIVIGFVVCLTTAVCFLSNPKADDTEQNILAFDFIESIGEKLDDSAKAQLRYQNNGYYSYVEPVTYHEIEFQKYLTCNGTIITGGGYSTSVEDKSETLTELVTALKAMLTELYGEPLKPTDAKEKMNRIGDITDFTGYDNAYLCEKWSVPCTISENAPDNLFGGSYTWREIQERNGDIEGTVCLELYFIPELEEVRVYLDYQINLVQFITPTWSTEKNPAEVFDFSYKEYFGNTMEEFFVNTGLNESDLIQNDTGLPRHYLLDSSITYRNRDFSSLIGIYGNPEIFTSLKYLYRAETVDEDFNEFARLLYEDISNIYGESEKALAEIIGSPVSAEIISKSDSTNYSSFGDYWYIPDSAIEIDGINETVQILQLQITTSDETGATILLSYGVIMDRRNLTPYELQYVCDFDFLDYLGHTIEDLRRLLNIPDSMLKQENNLRYTLTEPVLYKDIPFTHWWNTYAGLYLTGGGCYGSVDRNKHDLSLIIDSLRDLMIAEYGGPTTDPEAEKTLGRRNDFSEFEDVTDIVVLNETWSVACKIPLELFESNTLLPAQWKTMLEEQGEIPGTMHMEVTFFPDSDEVFIEVWYAIDLPESETFASDKTFTKVFDFTNTQYFGKTLQEISLNTGLDEDSLTVSEYEETSYYFDTTVEYQGREFYPLLHFEQLNNTLAGVGYAFQTETMDEELFSYIQTLRDDIIEIYGTPHTAQFADPSTNYLSGQSSMEQMLKKSGMFSDYWIIPYSDTKIEGYDFPLYQTIYLRVMFLADGKSAIVWLNHCLSRNDNPSFQLTEAFDFYFMEHLGRQVSKICWDLNIFDDIITKDTDYRYTLNEPIYYKNIAFSNWWNTFSGEYLTGGGYVASVDRTKHDLADVITSIRDLMIENYGKPTTDPNSANTLGQRTDYSEFENITDVITLSEIWPVNCNITLTDMETNHVLPDEWKYAQEQNGEVPGTMHMEVTFFPDSDDVLIDVWYSIDL